MEKRYRELKKEILGENYSLAVVSVSAKKSQELNRKYRGKNKPTNVLAFPYSKREGEIILCDAVIKKEGWSKHFLVIHGMLHLKGMTHSSKMERLEAKYDKKYFDRNRRGLAKHSTSGGRIQQRRKKS